MGKRGFTLIELIMIVAIIAIIAGMVVLRMQDVVRDAEKKMILSELATIRDAAMRFKQDMGEPPQFLAELLQSPEQDPDAAAADGMGGWWWRSDGNYLIPNSDLPPLPEGRLCSYDPVTRRGWNGPYLQGELFSDEIVSFETKELRETRINPGSAADSEAMIDSDAAASPAKRIAILKSDYSNFPQAKVAESTRKESHYQLVFDDLSGEVIVRFLDDPTIISPLTIAEIRLGVKP